MDQKVFLALVSIILKKKNYEVKIHNNDGLPKIFYIGYPKCGSKRIFNFTNVSVAHWHSTEYFERIYDTQLLSSNHYDIYDFVLQLGKYYNYKPLIIEFVREPITRSISLFCQTLKFCRCDNEKAKTIVNRCLLCQTKNGSLSKKNVKDKLPNLRHYWIEPYSFDKWNHHFRIDLYKEFDRMKGYFYREVENAVLLLSRFEDPISNITWIFKKYGYVYKDRVINSTAECEIPLVQFINRTIKTSPKDLELPQDLIKRIYDQPFVKLLYSTKEIERFKNRLV
jgi:hypothetical protein